MTDDTYQKIIDAVRDYIEMHGGKRPTIVEIGAMVGIDSTSHILYHLSRAVLKGDLVEDGEPKTSRRYTVPE